MSDDPLADFDLRARVAELEAERNVYRSAAWEYERRVAVAEARVAELEAMLKVAKENEPAQRLQARVAELEARTATAERLAEMGAQENVELSLRIDELERKQCDCGAKE